MELVLSKPNSLNPLWLTLLAEQLRTFGDFRTLDQHIKTLSDSVNGLLEFILKDLVVNDDTGQMEKVNTYIYHSCFFNNTPFCILDITWTNKSIVTCYCIVFVIFLNLANKFNFIIYFNWRVSGPLYLGSNKWITGSRDAADFKRYRWARASSWSVLV